MPNNRSWTAPRARWGLLLAFVLILSGISGSAMLSAAAPPVQGEDPPAVIALPPEAFDAPTMQAAWPDGKTGTKLESSLNDLLVTLQTSKSSVQDVRPGTRPGRTETRVHTQIAIDPNALEALTEAIVKAGGEVTGANADRTRIQGWLPASAINQIADLSGVYVIRRPDEAILLEPGLGTGTTTEALEAMNAPAWHAAGQIGAGIKVGVIDKGFMGYPALLGTDLPSTLDARNFVDGENPINVDGTTQHGTACAEIIYDIAPGASLYLAKVNTDIDLQEAVEWLKSENVDIISTSLTWYNVTPGDGTGEFADIVANARANGILWVTAAGNDRENHWGGPYVDSAPGDPNNDWHTFGPGVVNCFGPSSDNCYSIEAGEMLRVFLRWDDWTEVVQDYDLYLVRWNGTVWQTVNSSADPQEGRPGQRPTEYAAALTSGSATAYGFYIDRYDSSRAVNLEVFTPKARGLSERLSERSLGNLSDVPDAITVAAVDVEADFPQEAYSAEGPTNGPGGTATGGFPKPDIAAYANVSVQGYGEGGFDGTSAATPHVAGAAALVLGLNPDDSPDQVQAFLETQAVDLGPLGRDMAYGHGRLYLGEHSPTPEVTSITPSSGVYTGITHITSLVGKNYKVGTTVHLARSNHAPITGTNVIQVDETTLSLDLDLTGAANGSWDVVVTNPDGKSGTLEAGFGVLATATAPRVLSISPTVSSADVVQATILGQGFAVNGDKPTVKLTKYGQDPVVGTDVTVVDSAILTCQFDLTGASGGPWNVVVTNPNGEHWTLSDAFTVEYLIHLPYLINDYPPLPDPPDPLYPVEDTMVLQGDPTGNYTRDTDMWVGHDHDTCYDPPEPGSSKQIGRGLVRFDTTAIAPNTPFRQAQLFMYLAYYCDVPPGYTRTVTLYRVTSLWSADTVDWTTQPSLGEAVSSQTFPLGEERPWGWYSFDVTDMVRSWVEGETLNLGLGIIGPEGTGTDGARLGFITNDYLGGAYAPRILFSNELGGSEASMSDNAPAVDFCLPEPLVSFQSQGGASWLSGAGLCPAD